MAREDPQHIAWIKTKPCELCGKTQGVQAHHVHDKGKGQRPHDHWTIPLCEVCHDLRTRYRGFFASMPDGRWPRNRYDVYAWEQGLAAHYRWLHVVELERGLPY